MEPIKFVIWVTNVCSFFWSPVWMLTKKFGFFGLYLLLTDIPLFHMYTTFCCHCIYIPGLICRSKHTGVQCFYVGWECPGLPVCPAAVAPLPAGRTVVCRTLEEDCGCMAARMTLGWHAHTAGGRPVLHCPWPAGSCLGYIVDLRNEGNRHRIANYQWKLSDKFCTVWNSYRHCKKTQI